MGSSSTASSPQRIPSAVVHNALLGIFAKADPPKREARMKSNPTVAAVLAKDLAAYGTRRCFGLLGTANFKISHALVEAGVELISARHEGNAVSMGDAYAKATGELTLVSVHSGPGLTNALTGIGEAAKSRTPLLVLAGDVPTGAVKSNFYIEQAEIARSVGAISERIHTAASAREDTLRAVTRALRDRQTVVLSLPTDVQDAPCTDAITPLALPPAPGPMHPDPASVRRLADALEGVQRPLILAGRGAVISGAEQALTALAERSGALLATSVCGHGLFAENPWSVGISGGFASPAADELISESDLIIAFGASLTQWTTKRGKLIASGTIVAQIDIDASRNWDTRCRSSMPFNADARSPPRYCWPNWIAATCSPRQGWRDERYAQAYSRRRQSQRTLSGYVDHRVHRSAHAQQGRRRYPAQTARRCFGFRPFLRLGAALSCACQMRAPPVSATPSSRSA